MIKIDANSARTFFSDDEFSSALNKAKLAFEDVVKATGQGSNWLGWRRILNEPNDAELEEISRHAYSIREDADLFIICGIGGSFTGAKAIIDALNPVFKNNGPEIVYAGHHMSGQYLEQLMDYLKTPKEDGELKSVYLNVISKSGSTLETALAFRTIRTWMHEVYGNDAVKRIIATTGQSGGVLNDIIKSEGYTKYIIPEDIGGRFSVLTPVGLLPVAVAGIDIQTLYYGAVSEFEKNEETPDTILEYSAVRYSLHEKGYALDVLGSFEPAMMGFAAWTQQLLGESEGKEGKGLFPATASYSTDLHSFGQMIQQGQRNLIETLFVIEKPLSVHKVATMKDNTDQLSYLEGKTFHEINQSAQEGTIQAHHEGGVPVIKIIIEKLNEQQLGRLIYFYELMTAVYVYMLGVNPFNQPGVENYKKAMYRLLGKEE
ncbi:MAG: glucose-6-phosphate isomerase [Balneolaceae bacterium]|nr:MAG: glucose-6-phosphate isomerase [Balneolaceae bacterium]